MLLKESLSITDPVPTSNLGNAHQTSLYSTGRQSVSENAADSWHQHQPQPALFLSLA
ncbi:hypothetical protein PAMP_002293 [Pampus punctatissimus]